MAFPWLPIAIFASTLLPLLFKKGGGQAQQIQQSELIEQPRGYQSPLLGLLDPWMVDTLLSRYGLLSGAGMPGGKGATSPWTDEILRLLDEEWPKLLAGYRGAGQQRTGASNLLTAEEAYKRAIGGY